MSKEDRRLKQNKLDEVKNNCEQRTRKKTCQFGVVSKQSKSIFGTEMPRQTNANNKTKSKTLRATRSKVMTETNKSDAICITEFKFDSPWEINTQIRRF